MLQLTLNFIIKLFIFIIISSFSFLNAQELKMYQFYNQKGKQVYYEKVINDLKKYDVVLFGEHHNNSTNHWLQLQIAKDLYQTFKNNLVFGAEMFERDQQTALNQYLNNLINQDELSKHIKLWSNYKTDYKPIVDFAKSNHLQFIATNVPRRYAFTVSKDGIEKLYDLPETEKKWMVKLPYPIDYNAPGYPEMIKMIDDHAGTKAKQFVLAQAIKDATMAESIVNNWKKDQLFFHINGDYHSKNFGGIYWYLKLYHPDLKVAVIQILESSNRDLILKKEDVKNFIFTQFTLVLPEDTIKTY